MRPGQTEGTRETEMTSQKKKKTDPLSFTSFELIIVLLADASLVIRHFCAVQLFYTKQ